MVKKSKENFFLELLLKYWTFIGLISLGAIYLVNVVWVDNYLIPRITKQLIEDKHLRSEIKKGQFLASEDLEVSANHKIPNDILLSLENNQYISKEKIPPNVLSSLENNEYISSKQVPEKYFSLLKDGKYLAVKRDNSSKSYEIDEKIIIKLSEGKFIEKDEVTEIAKSYESDKIDKIISDFKNLEEQYRVNLEALEKRYYANLKSGGKQNYISLENGGENYDNLILENEKLLIKNRKILTEATMFRNQIKEEYEITRAQRTGETEIKFYWGINEKDKDIIILNVDNPVVKNFIEDGASYKVSYGEKEVILPVVLKSISSNLDDKNSPIGLIPSKEFNNVFGDLQAGHKTGTINLIKL